MRGRLAFFPSTASKFIHIAHTRTHTPLRPPKNYKKCQRRVMSLQPEGSLAVSLPTTMGEKERVIIVGAGPAGLAVSACLNRNSIPNLILEMEDCSVSLWRKRAYDRLHLHLAKFFCELPHMAFPNPSPTFPSKQEFIDYVESYMTRFGVQPLYGRWVQSTNFDGDSETWCVNARNTHTGESEEYVGRFLVVASGENSEGIIPDMPGIDGFKGDVLHSCKYKSGWPYKDQDVLVVGCGNSGMEIALDLCNYGAKTSIVVRNPVHVLTKDIAYMGMQLLKCLPISVVDSLVLMLANLEFGDLKKFGISTPTEGPFFLKDKTGQSPVIDAGTVGKIQSGEIKVCSRVKLINGNNVEFDDGEVRRFDSIIFATGYKSTVMSWLKDDDGLFGMNGLPAAGFPNHWKGKKGLYCAGFSRRGLFGISEDARHITEDISLLYYQGKTRAAPST